MYRCTDVVITSVFLGGEAGIRTLDTGFSPYNGLANRRLRPLGHLTARLQVYRDTGTYAEALTDEELERRVFKPSRCPLSAIARVGCIVRVLLAWGTRGWAHFLAHLKRFQLN